jgi:hypothetical protein
MPEGVAGGNRLRSLAKAHVIGQQQSALLEKPINAFALIRVERLLESLQR